MASSNRYTTYLLGSVGSITKCTKIVLFNKRKIKKVTVNSVETTLPRVTLSNISNIWSLLKKSSEQPYIEITREDPTTDSFLVETTDTKSLGGFNILLYINEFDDSVNGYTEFISVQGKENVETITIQLDFTASILGGLSINLSNKTSTYPFNATKLLGDELWNYTKQSTIEKHLSDFPSIYQFPHFSKHLNKSNNSLDISTLNDTTTVIPVSNEDLSMTLWKCSILANVEVNPWGNSDLNYQIGYFWNLSTKSPDIAIYSWTNNNRCLIRSLSKLNRFGRPQEHTDSMGYLIPNREEDLDITINYFSDRFAICSDSNHPTIIYDVVYKNWLDLDYYDSTQKSGYRYLMDETGRDNSIYKLPVGSVTKANVLEYFPDLLNNSYYQTTYMDQLYKKRGNWLVFSNGTYRILSSLRASYKIKAEDYSNVLFVNDETIMIKTLGTGNTIELKIYNTPGSWKLDENISDDSLEYLEPTEIVSLNLSSGVDPCTIAQSGLSHYRRGIIPTTLSGITILTALDGFIFYHNGKELNYL